MFKTTLKPLFVFTVLAMTATVAQSAEKKESAAKKVANVQKNTTAEATTKGAATTGATYQSSKDGGVPLNQSASSFQRTGRPEGLDDLTMPADNIRRSAGRFGEWRTRESGRNFHEGVDMSIADGTPLKAGSNGTLRQKGNSISGYGISAVVQRPNQDYFSYHHMQVGGVTKTPLNNPVARGDVLGRTGNTGGVGQVHLHMNYAVNQAQQSRRRDVWLSNNGGFYRSTIGNSTAKIGTYTTDPTPYLQKDLMVANDQYTPYLGDSLRRQFNTLYRTNLPPIAGSRAPTKEFPGVVRKILDTKANGGGNYALTPEEAAAANMSLVNAAYDADQGGYGVFGGAPMVSYQVLVSFLSSEDGEKFGTLPPLAKPVEFDKMSMAEILDTIGTRRFGDSEWNKAMLKLSSKAMMTEYLMMNAEENFLSNQNLRMKNRVEMLIAGTTQARLYEYSKKIEALQIAAEAEAVPAMINIPLDPAGDEYTTISGCGGGSPMALNGTAVQRASQVLRQFEGFIAKPQWDVNHLRLGYGSDTITTASGQVVEVTAGMTVTREDAERDLQRRIASEFMPAARAKVGAEAWDKLPPDAQAVLTSLAYNYGSLGKVPTVVNAARAGDLSAMASAIEARQYDNNGVNKTRRLKEAAIVRNAGSSATATNSSGADSQTTASTTNPATTTPSGLPSACDGSGGSYAPPSIPMNLPDDIKGLINTLADAITRGEARSADAYNNGTACGSAGISRPNGDSRRISTMTPAQILSYENTKNHPVPCSTRLFAVGFWQFIPDTLRAATSAYPQYRNLPFNAENQRFLAINYLLFTKRSNLAHFLKTGQNINAAVHDLAKEWASFAVPSGMSRNKGLGLSNGRQSYYGNGNAANMEATAAVWTVLRAIESYYQKGGKASTDSTTTKK